MNNTGNRKALGRGLEALLPGRSPAAAPAAAPARDASGQGAIENVPVGAITPNPNQPRKKFDQKALSELADSIRRQGILQPILLRKVKAGFEIVAGERRFQAARLAGLTAIPAVVRQNVGDRDALELAIVENLQREDLSPLEQARGFERLQRQFGQSQEEIAERTGKDRTTVSNFLRLLKLDAEVQAWLDAGDLTMGHAKPLIGLAPELQRSLGRQAIQHEWSVREIERQVQEIAQAVLEPRSAPAKPRDPNVRDAEDQLTRSLGARVRIRGGGKRKGAIEIGYAGLDDFQRIYDRLLR